MRRSSQLLTGLILYGISNAMLLRSGLGLDPWNVFGQGVARITGLSIGAVSVLTACVVLALWIPLRQLPGLGTVANAFVIGPVLDVALHVIPETSGWGGRIAMAAASIALTAVATGLYVGAGWGPGPRDGLMTGLNSRVGIPIPVGRFCIEASVCLIGWLLGGTVGVATLAFAVLMGPLVAVTLRRLALPL